MNLKGLWKTRSLDDGNIINNIPKKYWYLSLRKMEVLVNYLQAI